MNKILKVVFDHKISNEENMFYLKKTLARNLKSRILILTELF